MQLVQESALRFTASGWSHSQPPSSRKRSNASRHVPYCSSKPWPYHLANTMRMRVGCLCSIALIASSRGRGVHQYWFSFFSFRMVTAYTAAATNACSMESIVWAITWIASLIFFNFCLASPITSIASLMPAIAA